jgi:glycosyltransferase involved in cell wall biosynthesis
MSGASPPVRVAVIADGTYRYDAISDALVDGCRFLTDGTGWQTHVFAIDDERKDWPVTRIQLPKLLLDPRFFEADLILYHWGIWSPIFDAMLAAGAHQRQAVVFHNVTPAELMPERDRYLIDRSLVQIHNLARADRLWPVSRTNAEYLESLGFDRARIAVIPLAVDRPGIAHLADKPPEPIELVFLGRIVPHKGILDLIEAIARLTRRNLPEFRLHIVGNLMGSDAECARRVQRQIAERDLARIVHFVGTVDDPARDRLLQAAHILAIPSYHEGFCKPAIEALRAGAIPVGYAAHNLRYIADGLCRMVPPGDVAALTEALAETILDAGPAIRDPSARLRLDRGLMTAAEFTAAARSHVDQFRRDRIAELTRRHAAALLTPPS